LGVLLLAVLLLLIMPALLYLIGRSVTRLTAKTPRRVSLPIRPAAPRDTPGQESRAAFTE